MNGIAYESLCRRYVYTRLSWCSILAEYSMLSSYGHNFVLLYRGHFSARDRLRSHRQHTYNPSEHFVSPWRLIPAVRRRRCWEDYKSSGAGLSVSCLGSVFGYYALLQYFYDSFFVFFFIVYYVIFKCRLQICI